ncbi:putative outer membrane protein [Algibacter lectus]|uniref:Putative outer membrane protein n=2 Tax=Algibacter lectus TaxID=221126 RepID=A0A090WY94_9FLAO|nr:putative outer membrane protein [Algibacter lectus]
MVSFVGCARLDEEPEKTILSTDILNSEETLEAAVAGMYRRLQQSVMWTAYFTASFGGDDITTHSASNKLGFREADWRRQTTTSERILDNGGGAYGASYEVIRIANSIIENKDNIVNGKQDNIDRLIGGEAHFMRAFSYLHLTRTFGEVPIVNLTSKVEDLTKASVLEIFELMEEDLILAESLLPDVYPNISMVGARPSKGTVKAYLAKVYMHWAGYPIKDNSKYAMAATKAKEVIDNEGTYGFELATNFRELWTVANRFNQKESVFAMVFCTTCGAGYSNRTTGRLGTPPIAGGWNETFGEITFYENMQANAIANGTTQRFADTYSDDILPRGQRPNAADWRNFSDEPHPIFRKIVGGDYAETINSTANDINRYFMRYAEVLLTFAEASARAGNSSSEAWEALNRVRRRAGATEDITSGDLVDLAFEERGWELAGEYERWYDLVRTERVVEFFEKRSPLERVDVVNNLKPSTTGDYLYFSPLPQVEIDLAPSLDN